MNHEGSAYGLWGLVLIESAFFIVFAFSFTRPRTGRDWRSFGAFSGFIVALFAEMYGFPLTIFLLSGWLARHYPGVDFLSHESGHLLHTLMGLKGDPHMDPFHILSNILIAILRAYSGLVFARFWQRELNPEDAAVIERSLDEAGARTAGFRDYAMGEGRVLHDSIQRKAFEAGICRVCNQS